MPEIIPAVLTTLGFLALRASSKNSSGVSDEAKDVVTRVEEVCLRADGPISYLGNRISVFYNLNELVVEHLTSEWDGCGVAPISWNSYMNAKEFISILPANVPNPEVAIEPDNGAISLEWYFGYRKLFAVSIGSSKRFAFSGLNGTKKVYGVSEFDETDPEVPDVLVDGIKRLSK